MTPTMPTEKSVLILFDPLEQRVDAVEVLAPAAAGQRVTAERCEGLDDALGKVAVDVRVHAGQRELDREMPRLLPRLEQRPPRGRRRGDAVTSATSAAK